MECFLVCTLHMLDWDYKLQFDCQNKYNLGSYSQHFGLLAFFRHTKTTYTHVEFMRLHDIKLLVFDSTCSVNHEARTFTSIRNGHVEDKL